uniref:Uncharacterized protein n=1 Tax=Canis lupus dingo TaxID=286419 RepID=A0A8C0KH11_CANLU
MTFVTKSSNQNLIIFLNKIQTTIKSTKAVIFFFFPILDQLDPSTLPDGRIWLLDFNPYFFQHNSFCMGNASKRVGLQGCAQIGFLVLFIMPLLILSMAAELPGSVAFSCRGLRKFPGQPGWIRGLAPPSAQGVILGTRDQVPHRAPCMEPASPSASVSASLPLCVSHE